MHCFKDHINNRKYFLHFIRLLLPPKSPILPNLGGDGTPNKNKKKIKIKKETTTFSKYVHLFQTALNITTSTIFTPQ